MLSMRFPFYATSRLQNGTALAKSKPFSCPSHTLDLADGKPRLCRPMRGKAPPFRTPGLNTKAFRLGRLPESHRLSAHQAAQPRWLRAAIFFTASLALGDTLTILMGLAGAEAIRYRICETPDLVNGRSSRGSAFQETPKCPPGHRR